MGNFWIAMLVAISAAAWIYSKFYKRTGGNLQRSLTTAAIVGLVAFLMTMSLLWFIG